MTRAEELAKAKFRGALFEALDFAQGSDVLDSDICEVIEGLDGAITEALEAYAKEVEQATIERCVSVCDKLEKQFEGECTGSHATRRDASNRARGAEVCKNQIRNINKKGE